MVGWAQTLIMCLYDHLVMQLPETPEHLLCIVLCLSTPALLRWMLVQLKLLRKPWLGDMASTPGASCHLCVRLTWLRRFRTTLCT